MLSTLLSPRPTHAEAVFLDAFDQAVRGAGELNDLLINTETTVGAMRSIRLRAEAGPNLRGFVVAAPSEGIEMNYCCVAPFTLQSICTHALGIGARTEVDIPARLL
ncbi:hypothetical protein EMIT093MI4_70238 [Pseudomonas sp. IT-93MI4]